jgi:hypothetical protein
MTGRADTDEAAGYRLKSICLKSMFEVHLFEVHPVEVHLLKSILKSILDTLEPREQTLRLGRSGSCSLFCFGRLKTDSFDSLRRENLP